MTNRIVLLVFICLTACGNAEGQRGYPLQPDMFEETSVNGRPCIIYREHGRGGISCDWSDE